MIKRVVLAVVGLAVLVGLGVGAYLYRLTAPVEVSAVVPVAATLPPEAEPTMAAKAEGADPATDPTAVGSSMATDTGPTATRAETRAAAKVYRIDPGRSKATYRVGEVFLENNQFNTAVGTTSAVSGEIRVDKQKPSNSRMGEIVIDISQLRSDQQRRDDAIRRNWLESKKYPLARFKNATLSGLPASVTEGKPFAFEATGDMTVRQATRAATWDLTTTLDGDTLRGTATTKLRMSRFGIKPPNIAGFVKAEDEIALSLDFVANAVTGRP